MTDRFHQFPWGIYGHDECRARSAIMEFWDSKKRDTVDIAEITSIPEHRVASVVSLYVASKASRRGQPQA